MVSSAVPYDAAVESIENKKLLIVQTRYLDDPPFGVDL